MGDDLGYRYQLTTYRQGSMTDHARGLHMLKQPAVGTRLVMYGDTSNRRIVTSPVLRMYQDPSVYGTYVETRNSVYLLQYDG